MEGRLGSVLAMGPGGSGLEKGFQAPPSRWAPRFPFQAWWDFLGFLPPAFQKALTNFGAAAVGDHSPASGGQHCGCCSFLKALGLPPESPGVFPTG